MPWEEEGFRWVSAHGWFIRHVPGVGSIPIPGGNATEPSRPAARRVTWVGVDAVGVDGL